MAKEKEEAPQIRYEQIKQLYILVESGEATEEQRETLRELAEEVISDNTDLENIFNDDADRDGNTSDEDSSSKEEKAKEGKASESSSSSTSSSISSLVESTVSEAIIGSVLSEVMAIPNTSDFSELAGDSAEAGENLAG